MYLYHYLELAEVSDLSTKVVYQSELTSYRTVRL
jgi:hypothetical protein